MTTTDLVIGGAIALFAARQLRRTFLQHLRGHHTMTGRDLVQAAASTASGTALGAAAAVMTQDGHADGPERPSVGWGGRTHWAVSVAARFAFLVWLYDVTDGVALSPLGFVQDAVGGTVWRPLIAVLGLTEVAAYVAATTVRAITHRRRSDLRGRRWTISNTCSTVGRCGGRGSTTNEAARPTCSTPTA